MAKSELMIADEEWQRYTTALHNAGHIRYQEAAKYAESMYLGAGRQWTDEEKDALGDRPWLEVNRILGIVNKVLGYHAKSEISIGFTGREIEDDDVSEVLSKVASYVLDKQIFKDKEGEVFADGLIQRRGYFDIRIEFDDNMFGNIKITTEDPLDIIPDPDSQSYDPEDWKFFIKSRWLTLDEIEQNYGRSKMLRVRRMSPTDEGNFGQTDGEAERNSFNEDEEEGGSYVRSYHTTSNGEIRARVIERQYKINTKRKFFIDSATGDMEPVPDELEDKDARRYANDTGKDIITRTVPRVRWRVCTNNTVLFDDWSPYDFYTLVAYFPFFRRGKTIGLVDNLISPQEFFNKLLSTELHISGSAANSGWQVEEGQLVNMDTEDLEDVGSQNGLIIERKRGSPPAEKIKPNDVPAGIDRLTQSGPEFIEIVAGVRDLEQSQINSDKALTQVIEETALPLAPLVQNLARTRKSFSEKLLRLIQTYYTEPRILMITSINKKTGQSEQQELPINIEDDDGNIYNNLSTGKYDVVITEVPTGTGYREAQFNQAERLIKAGVPIPNTYVIKNSILDDKQSIIEAMPETPSPEEQQLQQQQTALALSEQQEKINKLTADTANRNIETMRKAVEIGKMLKESPDLALFVDNILKGSGYDPNVTMPEETKPKNQQQPVQLEQQLQQQTELGLQ